MIAVVLAAAVFAIVASVQVLRNGETPGRTWAQLAFVWIVPFIGPLVTMHLLRREPEKHRLSEPGPPDEIDGRIDQRPATFGSRGGGRSSRAEDAEGDSE